jgi:hypothetical protein
MISKDALKLIESIISKYSSAITVKYAGSDAVPVEDLSKLLREGLVAQEDTTGSAIEDAWLIGRIREILPGKELEKITPEEFKRRYRGMVQNLPDAEKKKLELIKEQAKTQLAGLHQTVQAKIKGTLLNTVFNHANEYLGEPVKNILQDAYIQDKTLAKLVSDLRQNAGDFSSKWQTIATTEYTKAINAGHSDQIISRNRDKTTEEIYSYFLVVNDAKLCKHCHAKYLNPDGTPKIFTMQELISNGTNYGKKASDWKPSLAGMHPNCRCQITEIPPGWTFTPGTDQLTFKSPDYIEYKKKK